MKIQSVKKTVAILTVLAVVDGVSFEYTSFQGGAFEVYDFPRAWKGTPRFVGHLPAATGDNLRSVIARAA